ncbi:peroxisome assembly protein 12-like [Apostichopus japonicus]|uniref:peroxisome assembly protein 12-like n=1 Tax=Stichopus japonicus TaxID=307972 RepID=UPI003AB4700B
MAEYAAHLTSVADQARPSFFEVLAQESLTATLRPALSHFLKFIAEKNPGSYGWMFRYGDEIYALLDLILQNYFLAKTNGSFSENFYGMKRVPIKCSGPSVNKLSRREHLKSLAFLVFVPFIKLKLDKLFAKWKEGSRSGSWSNQSGMQKFQRVYIRIYPFIHMSWEGTFLLYQMRYLFQGINCHSPYMHLSGLKLVYLTPDDVLPEVSKAQRGTHPSTFQMKLLQGSKSLLGFVAFCLSQGLSVGVFFLQFLEWWYMYGDHQAQLAFTALPIPQPPKDELQSDVKHLLPENKSRCPLCQRKRTNDTTLSTSGFVFCYPCIFNYVQNHRCCPITKYPTSLDQVVKLYPPSD